jgi:hypothetical protein
VKGARSVRFDSGYVRASVMVSSELEFSSLWELDLEDNLEERSDR